MSAPKTQYLSAAIPVGARVVTFYRAIQVGGAVAVIAYPASAATGASGASSLGSYILENDDPKYAGKKVARTDEKGADADFVLLRTQPTMTATAQYAAVGTPDLLQGDFCEFSPGYDETSAPSAPSALPICRWVVEDASNPEQAGEAKKANLTLCLDRQNSASTLSQF
jgi:hypothetical protein